jgi:Zn-dependent protease/CBS domain-containing protein
MFSNSLPLGIIHGIRIRIHWSWAIVFVFLTWALATGYFPATYNSWSLTEDWLVAALASLLLFVSVLLHELSHSLVAQSERLPVSSITLFFFGGVSNLSREPSTAGDEFRITIAGPAASVLIGLVSLLLYQVIPNPDWLHATLAYLGLTNLLLAAFNLLPAFPLDGGRVLHSIIWGITHNSVVATRWASTIGEAFGWLFIIGGIALVFAGDFVNGIWFALIGWLIQSSAAAYRHAPTARALQALTVADVMTRTIDPIPPGIDLDQAVQDYLLREGQRALPVATDSHLQGILSMTDVQHVPQDTWPSIPVERAMTPADRVETVTSTMPVTDALRLMSEHRRREMPVVDNSRLVGLLTQTGVMHYFQLRQELGLERSRTQPQSVDRKSA